MKAEIISIGTELLVGSILNTNAKFLSETLAENAIDVYRQSTVGDNIDRIVAAFREAAARSDLLITSGGLGPTMDDVTFEALSKFISKPLALHRPTYRAIVSRLKRHGFQMTKLITKQCYVPQSVKVFQNDHGTAPGVYCETFYQDRKVQVMVLPGPPREMEPLFTNQALPYFKKKIGLSGAKFLIRSVKLTDVTEVQVAQKVPDLLRLKPPATVGIYAKPDEVELKIMVKDNSKKQACRRADRIEKTIRTRFREKVATIDNETLSSVIGQILRKNKETLALAESCTGGLLSYLVTQTPGSSDYYLGGVVSYHDRIKILELGIPSDQIKRHGAVSRVVAKKMAVNIKSKFRADYGIGITGIAGPSGGRAKKPVGLVFVGVASKQKVFCKKMRFFGNRKEIQSHAAHRALDLLRLELLK
ncbi:MAG: competence/damage-inducible protein A [Candidatus Omnitrophica bacterium CG1_02_49_16]|nr:MAG: competence/damage-inducible protein A [Candidatus Omnitrophica bacterium CG1_02_49_16]